MGTAGCTQTWKHPRPPPDPIVQFVGTIKVESPPLGSHAADLKELRACQAEITRLKAECEALRAEAKKWRAAYGQTREDADHLRASLDCYRRATGLPPVAEPAPAPPQKGGSDIQEGKVHKGGVNRTYQISERNRPPDPPPMRPAPVDGTESGGQCGECQGEGSDLNATHMVECLWCGGTGRKEKP